MWIRSTMICRSLHGSRKKNECVKVTVTAYVDPQHFAVMTLYIYIQDRYSNRGVFLKSLLRTLDVF